MPGFVVQTPTALSRQAALNAAQTRDASIDDSTLKNGDLWDIVRPLNDAMNIAEGEARYRDSVANFSKEQRAAHAVIWYVSDVQNGGHWQFFYNSTGILWEAAQKGLRDIGAGENALILSGAALRAGGSPPFELAPRQSLMKRLSPKFADLDERLNNTDPLKLLWDYVRANRAAFYYASPKTA